ncbi:MAG TPA: amidase family protein, partial [Solirubrobacteraceae bacterium]|nr:amidase family protein [Solirubrobacteraceae bacterium]
EPGFATAAAPARTIGRLRTASDPLLESAVDDALRRAELEIVELEWQELEAGTGCFTTIYFNEFWRSDRELVQSDPDGVGEDVRQALAMAESFRPMLEDALRTQREWRSSLLALFDRVELLALPTLPVFPPRLDALNADTLVATAVEITRHVSLFNAAGVPCTAQPVPAAGAELPASLQLVGPLGGEELLLATAERVEAAVA